MPSAEGGATPWGSVVKTGRAGGGGAGGGGADCESHDGAAPPALDIPKARVEVLRGNGTKVSDTSPVGVRRSLGGGGLERARWRLPRSPSAMVSTASPATNGRPARGERATTAGQVAARFGPHRALHRDDRAKDVLRVLELDLTAPDEPAAALVGVDRERVAPEREPSSRSAPRRSRKARGCRPGKLVTSRACSGWRFSRTMRSFSRSSSTR